ncbi:MAG TPA: aminopeptidase P family protein [Holophaga sp.]|nr:aminopeptidase P family protein [Holophaga sp.]
MDFSAEHPRRLEDLRRELVRAGKSAYLGASPITMGYLQGFWEGGGERFLLLAVHADGRTCMICPGLSATQAARCGIADVRPWNDGEDPLALFAELAGEWGIREGRLVVDNDMGAWQVLAMQAVLPRADFAPGHPVMSPVMRRKSPVEIACLLEVGRIADEAFTDVLGSIHIGMAEQDVARLVLDTMGRLGGSPTFCIAAAGVNSAEPHHHSDGTLLQEGDALILDFGCAVDGYQSDITRTVVLGAPDDELARVYGIVHAAHMAGRRAVRPGLPGQDVDRAARGVIEAAGFAPRFMHRTGHGIGLRGHEEPYIIEGNGQGLAAGECFSIEPGIYLPGRFGVRVENCVVCTAEGHRSLNAEPSPVLLAVR